MGEAIVSDLLTEILIPVAAVIGIAFALFQWVLVAKVKLTPERQTAPPANNKNGSGDYLIEEEEEGFNEPNVFVKCAEIQKAISEGCGFTMQIDILFEFLVLLRLLLPFFNDVCSVLRE